MSRKDTHVKHEGIIDRIEGATVYVRITQHSACSGCHVQSMCTVSDRSEKIIETTYHAAADLRSGQHVWIIGSEAMSSEALRLAFLYPFIVLCCALGIATLCTDNEITAGIVSLCSLVPYYFVLYLFRRKIRKDLVFTVEPQTEETQNLS